MTCTSKNPVEGFVPCQICGNPAPTHYPSGGPRSLTLYYNCPDHLNQSSKGVHEYCIDNQVPTLEAFIEKHGKRSAAESLRETLENKGLLESDDKPLIEEHSDEDQDDNCDLDQDGNELDATKPPKDETKPPKGETKGGGVVILVLALLLVCAIGAYMVRKRNQVAQPSNETPKAPPRAAEEPETAPIQPQAANEPEAFLR